MQPADAVKLVARLKSAFPRMTLDEEEMTLIIEQCALLHDSLVLNDAVDRIIRTSERFPSIAEIRAQYHACDNARRASRPALPEPSREKGIPEWVQVWRWQTARTLTERQTANTTSRQPVANRPPIKMRDFPQFEHPGPDAYTNAEYEQIRDEWIAAGAPTLGTIEEVIGTTTAMV